MAENHIRHKALFPCASISGSQVRISQRLEFFLIEYIRRRCKTQDVDDPYSFGQELLGQII
ncbi:hypothetical protein D3C75_1363490 [compost metagenome]